MELIQALHITDDNKIATDIASVPTDHLPIIEMFYGIEGEGSHIGDPRILLRVGGCRVACIGCDTPHSWGLKSSAVLPLTFVLESLDKMIDEHKVQRVAITGGEPMHYPEQMLAIAKHLQARGVASWLETSGLFLDYELFSAFDFISFDVKTPSSGPAAFNPNGVARFTDFLERYGWRLQGHVKMIVTGETDADWISQNFANWLNHGAPIPLDGGDRVDVTPVYITPACGKKSTPDQVRDRMLLAQAKFKGQRVRIIAQQHALLQMQ